MWGTLSAPCCLPFCHWLIYYCVVPQFLSPFPEHHFASRSVLLWIQLQWKELYRYFCIECSISLVWTPRSAVTVRRVCLAFVRNFQVPGWRNCSAGMSTQPCRGPEVLCQHPHWASHNGQSLQLHSCTQPTAYTAQSSAFKVPFWHPTAASYICI